MSASALLLPAQPAELPLRPARGPRSAGLRAGCPAPGSPARTPGAPGGRPARQPLRLLVGGPRLPAAAPAARQAPARRPARRPARLTRRGRLVVVAVVVGVLLVGFSVGRVSSGAATARPAAVPVHRVTVQSGETLWQLATRVAPHADPRAVVAQLERLNRLPGPVLTPGQSLVVPS